MSEGESLECNTVAGMSEAQSVNRPVKPVQEVLLTGNFS